MSNSVNSLIPRAEASLYFNCGPFQDLHPHIFLNITQFMSPDDIFTCMRVSRHWGFLSNNRLIWESFFNENKIPFVESIKGQNYGREFMTLRKVMPFSGKKIEEVFGPIVGEIPCISRKCFEKFFERDSFDLKKFNWETFQLLMLPDAFEGICCEAFRYIVDDDGNLKGPLELSECTGQKLTIPNNLRNLKILCEHPLAGKENMPVFDYFHPEVLRQCNICSNRVSLVFMRTCIADGSRDMSYPQQEGFVQRRGFQVTSLRARVFFDAISILISGICPDAQNPDWSCARVSDRIDMYSHFTQVGIDGFATGTGVDVRGGCDDNRVTVGVVPCISAEAPQPPALESVELAKGH